MTSLLFILLGLLQFLIPVLPALGMGESLADRAIAQGIGPELPPGIFFSIWGIIYSAYLITALWHSARPTQASIKISTPLILIGSGNSVWMISAQMIGSALIDFLLLGPLLMASWFACARSDIPSDAQNSTIRTWLHRLCTGLLAGWLTIAISISLPDLMRQMLDRGASDDVWHSLWLCLLPASLMSCFFTRYISPNPFFRLAIGWGLLGIFWNTYFRLDLHALGLMTLTIGLGLLYICFRPGPGLSTRHL